MCVKSDKFAYDYDIKLMANNYEININCETGVLKRLLIHSPDSGLGKVIPAKAQDWLFEDIVHLDTIRSKEYDYYVKTLLYFLDPEKIKGKLNQREQSRELFMPGHPDFHASDKVIELESLLIDILSDVPVREKLVAAVSAVEGCTQLVQDELNTFSPIKLAKVLISGSTDDDRMLFAPIPNFIFTRDLGIVINNFILLNKPAKVARFRESLLAKYIFFNHAYFKRYRSNVLEIADSENFFLADQENTERTTLECGDLMMVGKNHLLIGCSERTSLSGANEAIKLLFAKDAVQKITVIKIPNKRDFMHLDTVFTQVKKNMWVLLGSLFSASHRQHTFEPIDYLREIPKADHPEIIQFEKGKTDSPKKYNFLEDLLTEISAVDLNCTEKPVFIYSGDDQFPYDAREQWTDSCNLLALREGVVIGYDRNDKTIKSFEKHGFTVIPVAELLDKFESGELIPDKMTDTLILMPSAELSRARGGFHCMSFPLLRTEA